MSDIIKLNAATQFLRYNPKLTWFTYNELMRKQSSLKITIVSYPKYYYTEDHLACLLFDFNNFPLERVIQRFEREGGKIVLDSELYAYITANKD